MAKISKILMYAIVAIILAITATVNGYLLRGLRSLENKAEVNVANGDSAYLNCPLGGFLYSYPNFASIASLVISGYFQVFIVSRGIAYANSAAKWITANVFTRLPFVGDKFKTTQTNSDSFIESPFSPYNPGR